MGGVFVCGDGQDLSGFALGSRHELMTLAWGQDDTAAIELAALIGNGAGTTSKPSAPTNLTATVH